MSSNQNQTNVKQTASETITNNVAGFSLDGQTINWGIKNIYVSISNFPKVTNHILDYYNKQFPIEFRRLVDKNAFKSAVEYLDELNSLYSKELNITYDKSYELDENGKETKKLISCKIKVSYNDYLNILDSKVKRGQPTKEKLDKKLADLTAMANKLGMSKDDLAKLLQAK